MCFVKITEVFNSYYLVTDTLRLGNTLDSPSKGQQSTNSDSERVDSFLLTHFSRSQIKL